MSVEGLEMLRKHMAYYDFAPDSVLLLGNVFYYAKKAEVEVAELEAENAKLRELLQRLLTEYRYISVRPRKVYMRHEERMRTIEEEMRELGVELP